MLVDGGPWYPYPFEKAWAEILHHLCVEKCYRFYATLKERAKLFYNSINPKGNAIKSLQLFLAF